jgi:hypothetical protein
MIVQMTICLALPFKTADVLQELAAFITLEALRVKTLVHGVDDPSDNGTVASCTNDCTARRMFTLFRVVLIAGDSDGGQSRECYTDAFSLRGSVVVVGHDDNGQRGRPGV